MMILFEGDANVSVVTQIQITIPKFTADSNVIDLMARNFVEISAVSDFYRYVHDVFVACYNKVDLQQLFHCLTQHSLR